MLIKSACLHILTPKNSAFQRGKVTQLQFVLKVAAFRSNTLTQSNTPLMHCSVNDSLVEVTPLFDKSLLQMVKVSNPGTVHAFLEHTPQGPYTS